MYGVDLESPVAEFDCTLANTQVEALCAWENESTKSLSHCYSPLSFLVARVDFGFNPIWVEFGNALEHCQWHESCAAPVTVVQAYHRPVLRMLEET